MLPKSSLKYHFFFTNRIFEYTALPDYYSRKVLSHMLPFVALWSCAKEICLNSCYHGVVLQNYHSYVFNCHGLWMISSKFMHYETLWTCFLAYLQCPKFVRCNFIEFPEHCYDEIAIQDKTMPEPTMDLVRQRQNGWRDIQRENLNFQHLWQICRINILGFVSQLINIHSYQA